MESYDNAAFAARIDKARKAAGLSQNFLETALKMPRGYIARIRKGERGASIKREWVVELPRLLKVRPEWLFAGIGPESDPDGTPPRGGRAFGLYLAALAGAPRGSVDAVAKQFEAPEYAELDPMVVFGAVLHDARIARDLEAAHAAHADNAKKRRKKIDVELRKAERATAKKKRETPPLPAAPVSKRNLKEGTDD